MDLTPYVDNLRRELAAAADASGDEARALAERLSVPLESAARLTLLNVLSAAMGDVTRELAPGSVDVRLRGTDPEFVVTPPPAPEPVREAWEPAAAPVVAAPPAAEADDGAMVRINLRLPAHLKGRAEGAAAAEGLSVNAWLVRAVAVALDGGGNASGPGRGKEPGGRGFTGWVR